MNTTIRIGIDLGGTKIEIIALAEDGAQLLRRRIDTPRNYSACLQTIADLVRDAERELNAQASVGVGIPGTLSPGTGLVVNANSTWLNGHPLDRDLTSILARPAKILNDANCFTLSEAVDGAGADAAVVFGVILGTGVGGGLVVHGQLMEGHQRIAGEWGHNPLPGCLDRIEDRPLCHCGRRGCIESYLSGPGLESDHRAMTGHRLSSHDIVAAWQGQERKATATMQRYFQRLAQSLATVINIVDPEVIVFGGGMSNIPGLITEVGALLQQYVFCEKLTTQLRLNRHGDSSGVRGAAWLWPQ